MLSGGGIQAYSSGPPVVRVSFTGLEGAERELQICSDILSMQKDTSCGVDFFFFSFNSYTISMLLSSRINIL